MRQKLREMSVLVLGEHAENGEQASLALCGCCPSKCENCVVVLANWAVGMRLSRTRRAVSDASLQGGRLPQEGGRLHEMTPWPAPQMHRVSRPSLSFCMGFPGLSVSLWTSNQGLPPSRPPFHPFTERPVARSAQA